MNARLPAAAVKRPTNVSISTDLLDKARSLGINLSRTLELGLREVIREKERELWLRENRAAIEAYNERLDRDGVWSDGLRSF